jgi:hypothetical protein
MSRGPGKVERAIESAFRGDPTRTYTIEELVQIAYPAARVIERKHLVIARLAAQRAALRCHWISILAYRTREFRGWQEGKGGWNKVLYVSVLDEATLLHWCGGREDDEDEPKDPTDALFARERKLKNRHLRWRSQIARWLVAGETDQAAQLQTQLDREQHLWQDAESRWRPSGITPGLFGVIITYTVADHIVRALLNGDHALVAAAIERGDEQFRYPG